MSVQELESAVSRLSKEELALFSRWFEEYTADPERSEWATLGGRNIGRAYGENEPEYTTADLRSK